MVESRVSNLVTRIDTALTRRRLTRYPVALLLFTLLAYGITLARSTNWIEPSGEVIGHDFLAFYMAGDMVNHGQTADLYRGTGQFDWQKRFMQARHNSRRDRLCLYLNPPYYAWAMSWLARLSYGRALIAWWTLSLLCFATTAAIWRQWLPRQDFPLAVLLTVCLPAWFFALAGGQNTFFSLLILTGFCHLLMRKHYLLAGLVLSLLAYKFQFLILPAGALLLTRRWRAFTGLLLGAALTLALTIIVMGPQAVVDYMKFAARLSQLDALYRLRRLQAAFLVWFRRPAGPRLDAAVADPPAGASGLARLPDSIGRNLATNAPQPGDAPPAASRAVDRHCRDVPPPVPLRHAAVGVAGHSMASSCHPGHNRRPWRIGTPHSGLSTQDLTPKVLAGSPAISTILAAIFAWLIVGVPLAAITHIQLSPILMTLLLLKLASESSSQSAMASAHAPAVQETPAT